MKRSDAIIPLNDPLRSSELRTLHDRIRKAQGACEHGFRLYEAVTVHEHSLGRVEAGKESIGGTPFDVMCLKCDKVVHWYMTEHCPQCLGPMQGGDFVEDEAELEHLHVHLGQLFGDGIVRYDCVDSKECGLKIYFIKNDR